MKKIFRMIFSIIAIVVLGGIYLKLTAVRDERGILRDRTGYQNICLEHIDDFYPLTVGEVKARSEYIQVIVPQELQSYLSQDPKKITKQEALYVLDGLSGYFEIIMSQIYLISMVHPQKEVADAAKMEIEKLERLAIDLFSMNRTLYLFLKEYYTENVDKNLLLPEEKYDLEETIKSYERNGLNLSDDVRKRIGDLKKELADLEMQFNIAIAQDARTIKATEEELRGLPQDFITTLSKDEKGLCVLKTDYPTSDMVMQHCSVEKTRKNFYEAFIEKAYPVNDSVLKIIISKRHDLAQLLGFKNFSEYDLSSQMAKKPEVIWDLFKKLEPAMKSKAKKEIEKFCSDLPEGVTLSSSEKVNPWDLGYITTQYKKKHYQFDELVMAEYFPLKETIQSLFKIYEQFFSITLQEVSLEKGWHDDVFVIEVRREDVKLGYIFIDLHPRDNKYNHAAVFSGKNTHKLLDGTIYPGICTLVCNFTKPTETKPALLKYAEVETFFHEFGHALHNILSNTYLLSQSGTQVKRDFVELPSQILELWLEDKTILKSLGKHYQTGEHLPDDLVDKKLEILKLSQGYFESRQAVLAQTALALFEKPEHDDMYDVYYRYLNSITPFINQDQQHHFLCNFGHLCGYGAKYYGYLWTRILAADVFEQIKEEGLLNPAAGKRYLDAILSRGGSKDPNDLLFDYLGRKPSQEAFLRRNKFN
jgi:thimet oligopeptidase